MDVVRRMHGVLNVRQDRDALEIQAKQAEPLLRELLNRDLSISGIEVASAGLEEAFVALTRDDNNSQQQISRSNKNGN